MFAFRLGFGSTTVSKRSAAVLAEPRTVGADVANGVHNFVGVNHQRGTRLPVYFRLAKLYVYFPLESGLIFNSQTVFVNRLYNLVGAAAVHNLFVEAVLFEHLPHGVKGNLIMLCVILFGRLGRKKKENALRSLCVMGFLQNYFLRRYIASASAIVAAAAA